MMGTDLLLTAVAGLAALVLAAGVFLRAWSAWLDYKKLELSARLPAADPAEPRAGGRIELADLRERVRKLEAIAAGIDL